MEEPGFMVTRKGLELARLNIVPVPVDAEGLNVGYGIENAADAALAVVTPGQQAPLGSTLSPQATASTARMGSLEPRVDHRRRLPRRAPTARQAGTVRSRRWTRANGSSTSVRSARRLARGCDLDLSSRRTNWPTHSPRSPQRLPRRHRQSFSSPQRNSCVTVTTSGACAGSSVFIPPSATRYANS